MPRNQSTAAQRARAAQRETGAKYTAALRQATTAGASPTVFSLRELLAECTTSPEWTGDHPEVDAEWAPRMFDSALLGRRSCRSVSSGGATVLRPRAVQVGPAADR